MDTTTAKDIMSPDVLVARKGINIEDAVRLLVNNQVTGLPVVDAQQRVIGVLSEFDLIQQIGKGQLEKPRDFKSAVEFSKSAETIDENASAQEVVDRFVSSKFRRLPVINKKKELVGIITRRDIIRLFYYRARFTHTK